MHWLTTLARWLGFAAPSTADAAPDPCAARFPGNASSGPALALERPLDDDPDTLRIGWWTPRCDPEPDGPRLSRHAQPIDPELHRYLTRAIEDSSIELPRLPHVAQRGLSMLRDENLSFTRLAEALSGDAVVTADVLRVANSPLYRTLHPVRRLDTAITRLGRNGMRSVLMTCAMRGLKVAGSGLTGEISESLWRCALASGVIMEALAKRTRVSADDAYLAGLLHDLGRLAVLRVIHDYHRTHARGVTRALFEQLADQWHEHLGLRLAEAWNLPDPLPELVGSHHGEAASDDPLATWRGMLQFADACCALLEYAPYRPLDLFELPCAERLRLRSDDATLDWLATLPERIESRLGECNLERQDAVG